MKYVDSKIRLSSLTALALIIVVAAFALEKSLAGKNERLRVQAQKAMQLAIERIKKEHADRGIPFAKEDVNQTGIIGEALTPLVTTLGSLESKRLSANPYFAAVVLDFFLAAGLKGGDVIAVGFSGSFPGLNIAVLAAAHALKLKPIVISSVGASKWGATNVGFTWLDMERVLYDSEIFPFRSIAASRGGRLGEGFLFDEGRAVAGAVIERNGIREIYAETLAETVTEHLDAYVKASEENSIRLFVNVGGSSVNVGRCDSSRISPGLIKRLPSCTSADQGLIHKFFQQGIPVLHLLNVAKLALRYGVN